MSSTEESTSPTNADNSGQPDSPPPDSDEFWAKAEMVYPGCSSDRYAVRVDQDLYEWFVALGPDYEMRVNDILRSYMESQQP